MVKELDSLEGVTLDVTVGSPAKLLYGSLGFEVRRSILLICGYKNE